MPQGVEVQVLSRAPIESTKFGRGKQSACALCVRTCKAQRWQASARDREPGSRNFASDGEQNIFDQFLSRALHKMPKGSFVLRGKEGLGKFCFTGTYKKSEESLAKLHQPRRICLSSAHKLSSHFTLSKRTPQPRCLLGSVF